MKTVSVEEPVANMVERSNARIGVPIGFKLSKPGPGKRPGDFVPGPQPKDLKTDAVELLIEDRESE